MPASEAACLRRHRFLSKESGGKERVRAGDFDFPRPDTPPLKTTNQGGLRAPLLDVPPGGVLRRYRSVIIGKILLHKVHLFHGEHPAPQILQNTRVGGEGELQLVGVQGLEGASVLLVVPLPSILAVPQQRVAGGGELGPDLMGAAGQKLTLHQGQPPVDRQRLI